MIRSPAGFDGEDRIKRYLDYYQPSYGVMMLSAGQFSPLQLFASGEQGVWYDPSDMTTLFQDSAGTIPVTAVEQPVGLMLDKSKGLVLGPELVTNGTFESGISDWQGISWNGSIYVADNAVISYSDGKMLLSSLSGKVFPIAEQAITTVVGKTYAVNYSFLNVASSSGPLVYVATSTSIGKGASNIGAILTVSAAFGTSRTAVFVAQSTTTYIKFYIANSTAGASASIDNISVRELPGNHASQSTSASRPVLKQDVNGKYYLLFDGTDDSMATATINPGSVDKAQVFAGVRKLSDASQVIAEFSATIASNPGAFNLYNFTDRKIYYESKGTILQFTGSNANTSPYTAVVSGISDISGDLVTVRENGVQISQNTGNQGTGNYLSYPLYIGRRAGTSLPFNGHLYSLIARFGANLPDATIAQTETWVNGKTGAY